MCLVIWKMVSSAMTIRYNNNGLRTRVILDFLDQNVGWGTLHYILHELKRSKNLRTFWLKNETDNMKQRILKERFRGRQNNFQLHIKNDKYKKLDLPIYHLYFGPTWLIGSKQVTPHNCCASGHSMKLHLTFGGGLKTNKYKTSVKMQKWKITPI